MKTKIIAWALALGALVTGVHAQTTMAPMAAAGMSAKRNSWTKVRWARNNGFLPAEPEPGDVDFPTDNTNITVTWYEHPIVDANGRLLDPCLEALRKRWKALKDEAEALEDKCYDNGPFGDQETYGNHGGAGTKYWACYLRQKLEDEATCIRNACIASHERYWGENGDYEQGNYDPPRYSTPGFCETPCGRLPNAKYPGPGIDGPLKDWMNSPNRDFPPGGGPQGGYGTDHLDGDLRDLHGSRDWDFGGIWSFDNY